MKITVSIDQKQYQVEIENIHARPVVAVVDGERFEVMPEETMPAVAAAPAATTASPVAPIAVAVSKPATGNAINAPLPGVIVAILVKPGDSVNVGQELCTLEAMKMKNAIRASRAGVVGDIAISVGELVKHGQLLISLKD